MMAGGWRYGWLTAAAALAVVLVVADFIVAGTNRSAQVAINRRQQFINRDIALGRVNQALVHALATAAVRNNDPRLRALLAGQGITIHAAPPVHTPLPPPAPATPASPSHHPAQRGAHP